MTSPRQLTIFAAAMMIGGCAALTPDRPEDRDARHRLDRGLSALDAGAYAEAYDDLAWVYSHCPGQESGSRALIALAALELDPRNRQARPAVGSRLLAEAIQGPGAPRWARPLTETVFLTALALGAPHPDGSGPHTETTAVDSTADTAADSTADNGDTAAAGVSAHAESERARTAAIEADQRAVPVLDPALQSPGDDSGPVYGCGDAVTVEDWAPPALPTLPGPSMAMLLTTAEAGRDSAMVRVDTLQAELAAVRDQLAATRAELERIRKTLKP